MKKSSWAILGVICILITALVYLNTAGSAQLSEEERVLAVIEKGRSAIERKDLKGTLSCVSRDYMDPSGFTFETIRLQALQAFRAEGTYHVQLKNTAVEVHSSNARVNAEASVSAAYDGGLSRGLFSRPITISLRKEKSRRWLVIPVTRWRVISVQGLPTDFVE